MTDPEIKQLVKELEEKHRVKIDLDFHFHTITCKITKGNVSKTFRDNKSQFLNTITTELNQFI